MKYILYILLLISSSCIGQVHDYNIRIDYPKDPDSVYVLLTGNSGAFAGRGRFNSLPILAGLLEPFLNLASNANMANGNQTITGDRAHNLGGNDFKYQNLDDGRFVIDYNSSKDSAYVDFKKDTFDVLLDGGGGLGKYSRMFLTAANTPEYFIQVDDGLGNNSELDISPTSIILTSDSYKLLTIPTSGASTDSLLTIDASTGAIRAIDQGSLSVDESNLVHKTGDENIAGVKSFSDKIKINGGSTGGNTGSENLYKMQIKMGHPPGYGFTVSNGTIDPWFHINSNGIGFVGNNDTIPFWSIESDVNLTKELRAHIVPGADYSYLWAKGGDVSNRNVLQLWGNDDIYLQAGRSNSATDLSGSIWLQGTEGTHFVDWGVISNASATVIDQVGGARLYQFTSGQVLKNLFQASGNNFITGGNFGVGNSSPAQALDVTGNGLFSGSVTVGGNLIISTSTPASASATGTTGQVAWDASYIYICTATNTWKRVAIATW